MDLCTSLGLGGTCAPGPPTKEQYIQILMDLGEETSECSIPNCLNMPEIEKYDPSLTLKCSDEETLIYTYTK